MRKRFQKGTAFILLAIFGTGVCVAEEVSAADRIQEEIRREIRLRNNLDWGAVGTASAAGLFLDLAVLTGGLSYYFYDQYQRTPYSDKAETYRRTVQALDAVWITSGALGGALAVSSLVLAFAGPDRGRTEFLEGLLDE